MITRFAGAEAITDAAAGVGSETEASGAIDAGGTTEDALVVASTGLAGSGTTSGTLGAEGGGVVTRGATGAEAFGATGACETTTGFGSATTCFAPVPTAPAEVPAIGGRTITGPDGGRDAIAGVAGGGAETMGGACRG